MEIHWPLLLLILTPFLTGLSGLLARNRRTLDALQCGQAGILVVSVIFVAEKVLTSGPISGLFYLHTDALSVWFSLILGVVGATGTLYAVGYVGEQLDRGSISFKRFQRFFILFDSYLAMMLLAVNVENLGIMWIAIEGSTLLAALMIGFERNKGALEAGWKFVILSSVGIALALFGTILVYYASENVMGVTEEALRWGVLHQVADQLNPAAMKLAFLFALIGYGTKAGIAPMHSWLPDAHGEAPTPVSAMLSANMLTMAIYAILRFKILTDQAIGPLYTGNLLVGFGLFSVTISAIFLLIQQDFKRLFAYSSIEHMGIALVGFGLGGMIGVFGGLWHLLNHALAKSAAFYGAGLVLLRHEHKMVAQVPGLLHGIPLAGGTFLIAGLALAGMPPFGLFISEVAIATDAFTRHPFIAYGFLLVLTLAFVTLMYQILRMVLGTPVEQKVLELGQRCRSFATIAIAVNLGALTCIGLYIPPGLDDLLETILALFGIAGK